jgi:capsular polysaccharide biosynthesis protein
MVLTKDHRVFQEFSHHFSIYTLKKFLWKNPFYTFSTDVKKTGGVGAVLVSSESQNYYHWLNDVLPRIKLYEQVLEQIDHFCVSSKVPAKFLDILADFGIPKNKLLFVNEKEKIYFDHLYVSSLPGSEGRSPQWAVEYIREKLIKKNNPVQAAKKIYFRRPPNAERKILNEDAIIAVLQKNGFDIIEPDSLSIYEQVAMLQQTKIVIGAHGAALANLLFSQEGAAVIEFFTPDYFRTDCYYTLSAILKLNYWYIAGDKPGKANWGDIIVDENILIKTLQQINGG